jgi:tripartite-type tricarboxylate transporter receptor subunit TctC
MTATRLLRVVSNVALIVALALGFIGNADAQSNYPNRPIKMLVGFAAGGGTDVAARIVAQKMSEILGQSVLVENVTGASGMIAAQDVAKADPDGYTLMMGSQTTYACAPNLYHR